MAAVRLAVAREAATRKAVARAACSCSEGSGGGGGGSLHLRHMYQHLEPASERSGHARKRRADAQACAARGAVAHGCRNARVHAPGAASSKTTARHDSSHAGCSTQRLRPGATREQPKRIVAAPLAVPPDAGAVSAAPTVSRRGHFGRGGVKMGTSLQGLFIGRLQSLCITAQSLKAQDGALSKY